MMREVRIDRRGQPGMDAAEKLFVTRGEDGERLLPAPTGAALDAYLRAPADAAAAELLADFAQVQILAAVLAPAGATAALSDPTNSALLGDLL